SAEGIMASGHVTAQTGRTHAPTSSLRREESPCQLRGVHTWHEADISSQLAHVRFRGQTGKHLLILSFSGFDLVVGPRADIPSPEQLVAVHIPFTPFQDADHCETMRRVVLIPRGDYETPRVHHAGCWRGGVAARGARAAAGDAGDRFPEQLVACRSCTLFDRIPPWPSCSP